MKAARESLERLLAGYEPGPALVTDRWGDITSKPEATAPLVERRRSDVAELGRSTSTG